MRGMSELLDRKGPLVAPSGAAAAAAIGVPLSPRRIGPRAVRGATDARPARSALKAGSGDWLAGAVNLASGEGGSSAWLTLGIGACVAVSTSRPAVRKPGVPPPPAAPPLRGVLLGEDTASGGWYVRVSGELEPRLLKAAALRREAPSKGDLARCVLGESKGLIGVVLSVEKGLVVLRVSGAAERRVRVLPLESLCKLPAP